MIPQIPSTDVTTELTNIPSKTYKLQIVDDDKAVPYKELEYIEGTGTQWINTGIIYNSDYEYEIDFQATEFIHEKTYFSVCGTSIGEGLYDVEHPSQNRLSLIEFTPVRYRGAVYQVKTPSVQSYNYPISVNVEALNRFKVRFASDMIYKNDVAQTITRNYRKADNETFKNVPLSLFGLNTEFGEAKFLAKAKIFNFKVIANNNGENTPILDLIPAKDSAGVVCMFDKVSQRFLYNQGTGEFVAGAVVGLYNYPDRIMGYVDKLDAVKQAVYKILSTERYAYLIYSENYGIELDQYIGNTFDYLEANIESTLKDALTYDLRIKDVRVNSIEKKNTDEARIKFTVYSIYGDIQMEVAVSV